MGARGYAIGATKGFVYVRAEYPIAVRRLQIAIDEAREAAEIPRTNQCQVYIVDLDKARHAKTIVGIRDKYGMAAALYACRGYVEIIHNGAASHTTVRVFNDVSTRVLTESVNHANVLPTSIAKHSTTDRTLASKALLVFLLFVIVIFLLFQIFQ